MCLYVYEGLKRPRDPRVVTKQYSNGLFGSFDTFEPSKQTLSSQPDKQTQSSVCSAVWQTHMATFIVDTVMGSSVSRVGVGVEASTKWGEDMTKTSCLC